MVNHPFFMWWFTVTQLKPNHFHPEAYNLNRVFWSHPLRFNQTTGWISFMFRGNTQTWNHHLLKNQRVLYTLYILQLCCYLSKVSTTLWIFSLTKKGPQQLRPTSPSDPRRCLRSYWPIASVEPRASRSRSATSSRWPRPRNNQQNAGFVAGLQKVLFCFATSGNPLSKKSWWVLFFFLFWSSSSLYIYIYIYMEPGV